MPVVQRSLEIQASPSTVWKFFASQEGLRHWWEESLEIQVKVGGKHRHRNQYSNEWISGYVLEVVPERLLVLSWFEESSDWVHPTRLSFTLEAIPGGTRVTQQYDGFAGIGKPTWERTYEAYHDGIQRHRVLEGLKRAAESSDAA